MKRLLDLLATPALVRLFGIATGIVFVTAGLAKIGDPGAFAEQVHNFRLSPIVFENLIAITLPWVELVVGVALVIGRRSRAAAWICALLMLVFTIGVAQAVARGLDFECGCFGKASASHVGTTKLIENVGLTLVAWLATRIRR